MVVGWYDTLKKYLGEMTEWLMVPTWNVGFVKANGGSNPPLSELEKILTIKVLKPEAFIPTRFSLAWSQMLDRDLYCMFD